MKTKMMLLIGFGLSLALCSPSGAGQPQHSRDQHSRKSHHHCNECDHKNTACCGKLKRTNCCIEEQCIRIPARGSIPSAEIFVKMQGNQNSNKPIIIFAPGTCETSDTWACQQEELCKDFLTIAFDSRGTGRSSRTSPTRVKYTYELLAGDLHALVQKLGIKKFIYVGHSIGANVGIVYENSFPGEITKLVLVAGDPFLVVPDCAVLPNCQVPATCSACWRFPLETVSGALAMQAEIDRIGYARFSARLSKQFYNERCQAKLANAQALETEQFIRSGRAIFTSVVFNMWTQDIRPLVPNIKIPTLICTGSIDAITPTGASFYLHNNIPTSVLVQFIGKGHNLMVSDFQNFNKILVKFIDNCRSLRDCSKVFGPCCVCPLAKPVRFISCRCRDDR